MKEIRSIVKSAHWIVYTSLFWLYYFNKPSENELSFIGLIAFGFWTFVLCIFGVSYCANHWDDK